MKKCQLIIDTTCDLPAELIEGRCFNILHFNYRIDGEDKLDDMYASMTPHEFYERMRGGAITQTSQASPAEMEEVFRAAIATGVPTVYLSFTDALSSNFASAEATCARILEEFPDAELYMCDTKLPSTPEGLLVLEAMRQCSSGLTAKEMVEWVAEAANFTNTVFMVEDLDTLHRGGRIPQSVAVAGAKLNVKPMLSVDLAGGLTVTGVSRGRKKGIKSMIDFFKENREMGGGKTVLIGNADCLKDAENLRDEIVKIEPSANVIIHNIGLTIGSHVGPGMLSLSFWGKDRRDHLSMVDRIAQRIKGNK